MRTGGAGLLIGLTLATVLAGCIDLGEPRTNEPFPPWEGKSRPPQDLEPTSMPAAPTNTTRAPVPLRPPPSGPPATPSPPRFLAPVAMPQGEPFAAEPSIAITPKGTLFIAAPGPGQDQPNIQQGASWLWSSTDGGATWSELRGPHDLQAQLPTADQAPRAKAFFSGDADVAAGPDGWVYYSDWWLTPAGVNNFLVEATGDEGQTWQSSSFTVPLADATDATLGGIDRQWLVAGDGYVALFYVYFPGLTEALPEARHFGIDVVLSTDHGATWSEPIVVRESDGAIKTGKPFLAGEALVVPYGLIPPNDAEHFFAAPSEVHAAVSLDHGRTWTDQLVAAVPGGFDQDGLPVQGGGDAVGRAVIAWPARAGEHLAVVTAASADSGAHWNAPVIVQATGLAQLPTIAMGRDGHAAVAWYGTSATGDASDVDAAWVEMVAETFDGGARWVTAQVSDEVVHQGPFCARDHDCVVSCAIATPIVNLGCELKPVRPLLDFQSAVIDQGGHIHVAYAVRQVTDQGAEVHVHGAAQSA
jgi:hypothetical protein